MSGNYSFSGGNLSPPRPPNPQLHHHNNLIFSPPSEMSYEGPSTTATNSAGDARPLMVPTIQQVSTTTPAPQSTFQSSESVASFSGSSQSANQSFDGKSNNQSSNGKKEDKMKEQFEEDNFVFVEEEHRSPEIITIDSDSEYIADDNDDVICLDDDVVLLNDDDDKPQVLPNPAKDPHQAQPAAISASKAAQTSQNIKTANSGTFVNKTPSNEAPSLEHLNDRQIPELKNYHHRHRFQCTEAREEAGDDDMTCLNDKNNDAEQQLNHPPSLPIFFCRPCLDPFTTVNALRYHHREHHHGIKPYRCAFPDCTEPGPFSRQETAKKHIASQHGHRNVQQKYVAVDRFLLAEEKRALFSWLHSEEHRQCVEEYMSCKAENEASAAAEVEELADERFVSGPSGQLPSHTDYLAMTPEPPEASATVEEAATTNQLLPVIKKKKRKTRKRLFSSPPPKPKTAAKRKTPIDQSTLAVEGELFLSQSSTVGEEKVASLEPLVIALSAPKGMDANQARFICQRNGCEWREFRTLLSLKIHDQTHRKGAGLHYRCRYAPASCSFTASLNSNVLAHIQQWHTGEHLKPSKRPGSKAGPSRLHDPDYLQRFIEVDRASLKAEEALWAEAQGRAVLLLNGKTEESLPKTTFALRVRSISRSLRYLCRRVNCRCKGELEFDSVTELVEHYDDGDDDDGGGGKRKSLRSQNMHLNKSSTESPGTGDFGLDPEEMEDISNWERTWRKSKKSILTSS